MEKFSGNRPIDKEGKDGRRENKRNEGLYHEHWSLLEFLMVTFVEEKKGREGGSKGQRSKGKVLFWEGGR